MASKSAAEYDPAIAARKRARSGSSEKDYITGDTVQVPKKASKSDVSTITCKVDRVALLDAGAQYGKVWEGMRRHTELHITIINMSSTELKQTKSYVWFIYKLQ